MAAGLTGEIWSLDWDEVVRYFEFESRPSASGLATELRQ